MNESQHQQSRTRWLLNISMIILETIFSFVLKHDRVVRLQAQKFIDQELTVKVNSYIPYFDFYVQFTDKGLLFDVHAPDKAVDLCINSSLFDLIRAFALGNARSLRKMRYEGDKILKDEFQVFIIHLTAPKLLADWKHWLTHPDDDQNSLASKKRIAPLLEKIDQQRSKINSLQVEVKQYQNRVRRMQFNYTRLKWILGIISLLFTLLSVYNLWLLMR
ncbi:hypothetical protein EC844_105115 [Acinetobacter calcoaceticus]|uniref:Uncharacterized protein n=1 Tax=Acinetobacter calcoaceticus TaxID=471 RepID=A0A4R1XYX5_ACICA|nr:hypothetical protein EC844_105115 [Acinetobacter calcoaceticus]